MCLYNIQHQVKHSRLTLGKQSRAEDTSSLNYQSALLCFLHVGQFRETTTM